MNNYYANTILRVLRDIYGEPNHYNVSVKGERWSVEYCWTVNGIGSLSITSCFDGIAERIDMRLWSQDTRTLPAKYWAYYLQDVNQDISRLLRSLFEEEKSPIWEFMHKYFRKGDA